jgi:hypothetical protein
MSLRQEAREWSKEKIREEIQERQSTLDAYQLEVADRAAAWYDPDRPPPAVPFTNPHQDRMDQLQKELTYLKTLL